MAESFDIFQFADHLRQRLRFIGLACGIAVALSAMISFVLPSRYTATARVVIDPPAGSDSRTAMAVSPIYLESLKTYVLFASGDNLFLQASNSFGLRDRSHPIPIDRLKRSVLKVSIPQNTKVIEISCTLPDPRKAQALASYLAEQTVRLSSRISLETDRELAADAEKSLAETQARLQQAEDEWRRVSRMVAPAQLESEIGSLAELRSKLQGELSSAELIAVESGASDQARAKEDRRFAQVRADGLRKQIETLDRELAAKRRAMTESLASRDIAQGQLKTRQAAFEAAQTRLSEIRASAGYRGERLKIIDPGIVPESPSSPNVSLNIAAALLVALAASLLWTAAEFSYRRRRPARLAPLRRAAQSRD